MARKTRIAPVAALLALVACTPLQLEAPAPEGALECALDLGLQMGYEPVAGGTDSGFIRMERKDVGSIEQTITVTQVRGTMRIRAAGRLDEDEAVGPSGRTREDAERILAECGRR
jgi:hypothetical protein